MPSLGILLALTSAVVWGSGDFVGGAATRRSGPFQVLALSAFSGIVVLTVLAFFGEQPPSVSTLKWAALAGVGGAIGIISLYQGLALGGAAIVAPIAAVVTAVLPAIYTAIAVALPTGRQFLGFLVAFVGIWLVTRAPADEGISPTGLKLALLAGAGFGGFLIMIGQVERALVFGPLAVARTITLAIALVLMLIRRVPVPSPASNRLALLAGVLDAGGNVFFVLARQQTRLDVAAVLSSLYPVATVALARIVWREQVAPSQWIGMAVCLAAVTLMAD